MKGHIGIVIERLKRWAPAQLELHCEKIRLAKDNVARLERELENARAARNTIIQEAGAAAERQRTARLSSSDHALKLFCDAYPLPVRPCDLARAIKISPGRAGQIIFQLARAGMVQWVETGTWQGWVWAAGDSPADKDRYLAACAEPMAAGQAAASI